MHVDELVDNRKIVSLIGTYTLFRKEEALVSTRSMDHENLTKHFKSFKFIVFCVLNSFRSLLLKAFINV